MKPKLKHKFRAVVSAAFSLFVLTIAALPASAMTGENGGGAGSGTSSQTDTPFSYLQINDTFAWRADLYVSKNADGRINEDADAIGGNLALVGSALCTSENYANVKTYIQTNYTNESRNNFNSSGITMVNKNSEGDIGGVQYTLPTLKEFDPVDGIYTDTHKNKVAIDATGTIAVLKDQWGANNTGTDFKKVQDLLTHDGYEVYVSDFLKQLLMPEKGGQDFLDKLRKSLDPQLGKALVSKCGDTVTIHDIYKYLLPVHPETKEVNTECMVEWALVLTPIYRFDAIAPFYYYPPGSNSRENVSMSTCVALDAYWFAQYDLISTKLYNVSLLGPKAGGSNSGNGVLSRWLGCIQSVSNSGAPGIAAYCTKQNAKNQYLGVYTQTSNLSQYQWARLLVSDPSEYAKRGGISVFTTKIEAPTPKIYYHLYTYELDEQNPPAGYTVGTTYTPKDLLQFTP